MLELFICSGLTLLKTMYLYYQLSITNLIQVCIGFYNVFVLQTTSQIAKVAIAIANCFHEYGTVDKSQRSVFVGTSIATVLKC